MREETEDKKIENLQVLILPNWRLKKEKTQVLLSHPHMSRAKCHYQIP